MTAPEDHVETETQQLVDPVTGESVSKTELKRRNKQREKDAKKAEKVKLEPKVEEKTEMKAEETLDPRLYFENRSKTIDALRSDPATYPYPHKFHVSLSMTGTKTLHFVYTEYIKKYDCLKEGEHLEDVEVTLAGRLHNLRSSSSKLKFYDLHGEAFKVQIISQTQHSDPAKDFNAMHHLLQRGDIVGVRGFPGKSKKGELSIFARDVTLLTPCLRMLPKAHYGFKDQEARYRMRYLDLIMNNPRSKIIRYVRDYLDRLGFLEVETPMVPL